MNNEADDRARGISRLRLALAVGFGLRDVIGISDREHKLLFDTGPDTGDVVYHPVRASQKAKWDEVKQECVEIVMAWFMELTPDPPVDKQAVAIAFLRHVEALGGQITIPQSKLLASEELLKALLDDRVLERSALGYGFGRNYERAMREFGHLVPEE